MSINQIECFKLNIWFWKVLGLWKPVKFLSFYDLYSTIFLFTFVFLYIFLHSLNIYFIPRNMDSFIEEFIFYFTMLSTFSKINTFITKKDALKEILELLQSDLFRPKNVSELKIVKEAYNFNIRYWKIIVAVSLTSHLTHILSPVLFHWFLGAPLDLPVCSYSFLTEEQITKFKYPLYIYQSLGMHCMVWSNINIDTFFLGTMIYGIAQLDILDTALRNVTKKKEIFEDDNHKSSAIGKLTDDDMILNLNDCIEHFNGVSKLCSLIQNVFSITLFVQFSVASCLICVCLFRFTLPAPWQYYIFLITYMTIMIVQIMVPCWFGTRIIDKSNKLSHAVYACDWTSRSRKFRSNLRLFAQRSSIPLSITGWKMFPLSLITFTSIMNSAYSFFTLLRHMQTR